LAREEEARPEPAGFVMTETAQDILCSLRLLRTLPEPGITMIAGAPGVGKTRALRRFAEEAPRVMLHTVAAGEGKPWNIMCALMSRHDPKPNSRDLTESRLRLASYIGAGHILVVDEAQTLELRDSRAAANRDSFEWLRALAEDGELSLVLCGDLALAEAVAKLPQLQSRLRRPLVIRSVPEADVAALAASHGIAGPKELRFLASLSRQMGSLRNVTSVAQLASVYAGRERPDLSHLAAAAATLKLAQPEAQ
jgi:DNA transposition AAA+ family ATPase